jgi:hypothetical protein
MDRYDTSADREFSSTAQLAAHLTRLGFGPARPRQDWSAVLNGSHERIDHTEADSEAATSPVAGRRPE